MSEEGHDERLLDEDEDDAVTEEERQSGNQQFENRVENEEFLCRMRHYSSVLRIPLPYVGPPPDPDRSDPNDSDRSDPNGNDASDDIQSQHQDHPSDPETDSGDEDESDTSDVDSSDAAVAGNQIAEDQIAADGADDEIDEGPPEMDEEELLEWDMDRDTTDPGSDGFESDPWGLESNDSPPKRRRLYEYGSDFCALS